MRGFRFIILSLCLVLLTSIGGASATLARFDADASGAGPGGAPGADVDAPPGPAVSPPTDPAMAVPAPNVAVVARPAQFNSGSQGENGPFPPSTPTGGTTGITLNLQDGRVTYLPSGDTAQLPGTPAGGFSDGILKFSTVEVPALMTLTFLRNQTNTPVTILAQTNVNVAGAIDVSGAKGGPGGSSAGVGGQGGPGGFRGGNGEFLVSSPGAGAALGPGGGKGGGVGGAGNVGGGGGGGFGNVGASGENGSAGGGLYGSHTLLPLLGGSGGGGGATSTEGTPGTTGAGGGGGGGAILIAAGGTINVAGSILAKGGAGADFGGGGGSGGAIRLMAQAISGTGTLSTQGGAGGARGSSPFVWGGGAGGGGRIRLEAVTDTFAGTIPPTGSLSRTQLGLVLLPSPATLRITKVGSADPPTSLTGFDGGVDLEVATPGTVAIQLTASQVPLNAAVRVTAKPVTDGTFIGPINAPALTGTLASSSTTVSVTFPVSGQYFLEAVATFTAP
jgi:hypothetical protein